MHNLQEMNVNGRPYKVFITTPVIFCCSALFLLSRGIFSAPLQALFAAIFILAGVPLYYIFVPGWRYFPGLRMNIPDFSDYKDILVLNLLKDDEYEGSVCLV